MARKWIAAAVMSLTLGLVLNPVIAWCSAWPIGLHSWRMRATNSQVRGPEVKWPVPPPADWPRLPAGLNQSEIWACRLDSYTSSKMTNGVVPSGSPVEIRIYQQNVWHWGLPMRSLKMTWQQAEVQNGSGGYPQIVPTQTALASGLLLPKKMWRDPVPSVLPLMPVWPGFAINTLLYAAVAAALLVGPGMIRRALRRRRGQCARCGYELAGLAMCPECGPPAKPAAAAGWAEPARVRLPLRCPDEGNPGVIQRLVQRVLLWCIVGLLSAAFSAWAMAAWSERGPWSVRDLGPWLRPPPESAESRALVSRRDSWGVLEQEASGAALYTQPDGTNAWRTHMQYHLAAGWPFPMLSRFVEGPSGASPIYEELPRRLGEGLSLGAFRGIVGVRPGRHLPVSATWGLLAGTALHGAAWFVVWLSVRGLFGPLAACAAGAPARLALREKWEGTHSGKGRVRIGEALALVVLLHRGAKRRWRPAWSSVVVWVIFGVLGAVLSAWACGVLVAPRSVAFDGWAAQHERQSSAIGPGLVRTARGFGVDVYGVPGAYASELSLMYTGWPFRSMRFTRLPMGGFGAQTPDQSVWQSGYVLRPSSALANTLMTREWRIALRPVWPGLAWNVLFWALFAASMSVPLGVAESMRHLRRRACPWCGYPVGGDARCSECGSIVRPDIKPVCAAELAPSNIPSPQSLHKQA